jgi:hypothetical protein
MNSAQLDIDFFRKFVETKLIMNRIDNPSDIKNFIFAGNSTFTLKNPNTNKHFTYKVYNPNKNKEKEDIFFVKVLTGTNNETDYSYVGYVKNDKYYHGKPNKTKIKPDSPSVLGFRYLLNNIENLKLEFMHEGRCGRCGRKLTHPESLENGIGPECSSIIEKNIFNKKQSKIKF